MFVYSLPLLLFQIALLTPGELAIFVLVVVGFLWVSSPLPAIENISSATKIGARQQLALAWLGRKPLWVVFWPFFLGLNGLLWYVDSLAMRGEFTVSSWDAVHFVLFTPILFWTVCVWRNSTNCLLRIWAVLARLFALAVYIEYGVKLFLRIEYPREFFDCQDAILNYFVCF
jgi:hypothetical protein